MSDHFDSQILTQHTGWMRSLAIELVSDPHCADDLVQEAWLAYWRRPPVESEHGVRPWLRAVVRNLARHWRRGERRRLRRETECARDPLLASVTDELTRNEAQQRLVVAVTELEPGFREVVVLRFFDALSPREIAVRLGVSRQAVRSRLHRALAELRSQLDREYGGNRRSWLSVLPAVIGRPLPQIAAGLEAAMAHSPLVLMMKTRLVVVVCVVALLGGATLWWEFNPAEPVQAADTGAPVQSVELPPHAKATNRTEPERKAVSAKPEPEPLAPPQISGHVVDVARQPIANVSVGYTYDIARTTWKTTDRQGMFELDAGNTNGRLTVHSQKYVVLLDDSAADPARAHDLLLVIAPRRRYEGRVVDGDGLPLPRARISVNIDLAVLRGLRPGVQRTGTPKWWAHADEQGGFVVADVGWMQGATLTVKLAGYETEQIVLPEQSTSNLWVRLKSVTAHAAAFSGQVVDPNEKGLGGAFVFLGEEWTNTDRDGRFSFEALGSSGEVVVAARGYLPVRSMMTSGPITIHLTEKALSLSGLVVDQNGNPVADARVWTHDGKKLPKEPRRGIREFEDIIRPPGNYMRSGRGHPTDDKGRFRLSGLLRQKYTLRAIHPVTQAIAVLQTVEAGRGKVQIRFDGGEQPRRVAGRVISSGGAPLVGVRMFVGRGGNNNGKRFYAPLTTDKVPVTDAEGRFEFENLCVNGTYILPSSHSTVVSDRFYLDASMHLEELKIVLPQMCRFQVFAEGRTDFPDSFRVLSKAGKTIRLTVELDNLTTVGPTVDLVDGKSEVVKTDDRAWTLVLLRKGVELARVPLRLRSGPVQIVRL